MGFGEEMIGVYCADDEKRVVEEFFELFKTPWEFFDSKSAYDVVISTQYEMPKVNASLIIIYSSDSVEFDDIENVSLSVASNKLLADHNKGLFPVYGNLLSFQDSKTPLIRSDTSSDVIAFEISSCNRKVVRVGFNLFDEVSLLLSDGQPVENALFPTLEIHISIIRNWILCAGLSLIEIPPLPFGYKYFVCLTHDIDFVGLQRHKFDKTMWGFVYRGVIGSLLSFLRGRLGATRLIKNWIAVAKLPFVFMGLADDFWKHFDKYADIDKKFGSTFFLIPYKNRAGERALSTDHLRRAAPYGIREVEQQVEQLADSGFEIALHGIDAWSSAEIGSQERDEVADIIKEKEIGVRMHWLYYDRNSPRILDNIGFNYDASLGYNEAIGFRNGTTQVFRPLEVNKLLEIPLNIQDTALFYPRRLALRFEDAKRLCENLMHKVAHFGGLITLSWHDRSLEPERLWGEFYIQLLEEIQAQNAWIGSARQIVAWFRQRRSITFEEYSLNKNEIKIKLNTSKLNVEPQLFVRVYASSKSSEVGLEKEYQKFDTPLNGQEIIEFSFNSSEVK